MPQSADRMKRCPPPWVPSEEVPFSLDSSPPKSRAHPPFAPPTHGPILSFCFLNAVCSQPPGRLTVHSDTVGCLVRRITAVAKKRRLLQKISCCLETTDPTLRMKISTDGPPRPFSPQRQDFPLWHRHAATRMPKDNHPTKVHPNKRSFRGCSQNPKSQ